MGPSLTAGLRHRDGRDAVIPNARTIPAMPRRDADAPIRTDSPTGGSRPAAGARPVRPAPRAPARFPFERSPKAGPARG